MKHSFDFIDPPWKGLKGPLGVWEFDLRTTLLKKLKNKKTW